MVPEQRIRPSRAIPVFALYVGGVLCATALLAWPVWRALDGWGASIPFRKLVLDIGQALALVGVWPVLAWQGGAGRAAWGLARGAGAPAEVLRGLAGGLASLALVLAVLLALRVRVLSAHVDWHSGALVSLVTKALLTGFSVALFEELWFRGALHTALRRVGSPLGAILIGSMIFAVLHYAHGGPPVPAAEVGWRSGWMVVGGLLARLRSPDLIDSLAALFAAGVVLAVLREASGRIWSAVGMHAGWVAAIRIGGHLTVPHPQSRFAFLVGSYDGIIGWFSFVVFIAMSVVLWLRTRGRAPRLPA